MRGTTDNRLPVEWIKSSYSSNGPETDCVEVAVASGAVHVRDSKDCDGVRLVVAPRAWGGFLGYAASGG
ncbi:hypothetical protein J116_009475 [Streptomyces thermolilacinus SPC6]|uniref:DUF397 domain-containing protein n=2 Tax=Streptomyces thermolilacinus TaxID=285540 RepID=A0A1D3DQR5_9ACTN|nr:hypothetical protein J116_009475 [Streptomyces thermolilacinus SPC6]